MYTIFGKVIFLPVSLCDWAEAGVTACLSKYILLCRYALTNPIFVFKFILLGFMFKCMELLRFLRLCAFVFFAFSFLVLFCLSPELSVTVLLRWSWRDGLFIKIYSLMQTQSGALLSFFALNLQHNANRSIRLHLHTLFIRLACPPDNKYALALEFIHWVIMESN